MAFLNRRSFLRFTAGAGLGVGLSSLLPAYARQGASLSEIGEDIVYPGVIDLQVQETAIKLGGQNAKALTTNGSIPGPLIRLREGQTVSINVTNQLNEDTSIHWHGIILPPEMDGVPGVSFAGIKARQTFTYQFPVTQNGTYWYHSHSGLQEQQGHFGPIIIDPTEPEPFEYDQDYVVMLSDWTFEDPHSVLANLKRMSPYYNYQRRTVANLAEDGDWRRMRMDPTDIADVTGATYTYLMNGIEPDSNWTALFQPGDKVRLRFINASAMTYFDVRIPGLKMTVVQADGQNIQPVAVDEFRIAVAETYDVIVEPQTEQAYTIFAETMDRSGYARGTLAVRAGLEASLPERRERPLRTMADMGMDHGSMGADSPTMDSNMSCMSSDAPMNNDMSGMSSDAPMNHDMSGMSSDAPMNHDMSCPGNSSMVPHGPDSHGSGNSGVPMMVGSRLHEPGTGLENTGTRVLVYTDLRSVNPGYDQRQPERELELHLTGNMERYMWSFDGKKYSEEKELTFYNGERLRLVFVNDTMMEHPIHLHGMWMEVDNGAGEYKPRKHTINVKPAERLPVEVNVDAPGRWAFHCHLLYHMEVGMFRTVAVIDRPAEVG
ncbi:copper resistance system multicopper oxidase [Nodosilinea sp. LEGE 07088]|uniref:copper resistance system multicopper oxidase n=1 Tax=Nodosilinea sp. LEGE 07088 TaxID=2777968 RepID=UPI0018821232|nr:copper resistance system multicopper oxidase [Nodosilinea sp. LEGE 07088]MBE9135709.1 copper resistance system multicopper oxidase [Nodosilinea sp. LEGE 07088]